MKVNIVKKAVSDKLDNRFIKLKSVGSVEFFFPFIYITSFPIQINYVNKKISATCKIDLKIELRFQILKKAENDDYKKDDRK
jgi:hypothetical protein